MSSHPLRCVCIVSELFQQNTYIAYLDGQSACVVVDPGLDVEAILDKIRELRLSVSAILNTHGHADHIAGNASIKRTWPQAPLLIGANDALKLTNPVENLSRGYGIDIVSPAADTLVKEGDTVSFAGMDWEVLETPGHSRGHVVFVWKAGSPWVVLGGDMLFQGSIGRTDFPDGSFPELEDSIRTKLYTLPDDTIVLPGHGPQTTIGFEKRHNPFVSA